MTDRIALVTGGTSGIGLAVAAGLRARGARVIVAARAPEAVAARLGAEPLRVDLGDLDQVRAAADRVRGAYDRLDLLINNAAVMATRLGRTPQGRERQFAVNYLGHFALTGLLLDRLAAGVDPRVVSVSSVQHRTGRIRWDDLDGTSGYRPMAAYEQSKLAITIFGLELHRRLSAAGSPVASVLAHPGWAVTGLQTAGTYGLWRLLLRVTPLLAQSAEAGARPILHAATSAEAEPGGFYGPRGPGELRGPVTRVVPSVAAADPSNGRRLWEVSTALTGVPIS